MTAMTAMTTTMMMIYHVILREIKTLGMLGMFGYTLACLGVLRHCSGIVPVLLGYCLDIFWVLLGYAWVCSGVLGYTLVYSGMLGIQAFF